ncbi:hypothetical protein B0H16DRAFT_1735813 [Mycena metata]|uniref:DUF8205 domain-containing protein n=1 Tax=Mycena metata TaxID=1033252 RepID=A0AAD7HRM7_9AGAR|nr:hypothetical protein B0H16DRAFT_1735813 [Mycena metata]
MKSLVIIFAAFSPGPFLANPFLNLYLQAYLILHFDLLRHPHVDPPFNARVDIGIEPAEIPDFLDIFLGNQPRAGETKGMVQVNAVTPLELIAAAELSPERALFGNGESVQTIASTIRIHPVAMELVCRAEPQVRTSAITGEVTEVPFNFDTALNMHIRADKNDQLLLRTTLRPSDVQNIRDAAANLPTHSTRVLRAKMARESIYTPVSVSGGVVTRMPLEYDFLCNIS